jgi:hypothetical protein
MFRSLLPAKPGPLLPSQMSSEDLDALFFREPNRDELDAIERKLTGYFYFGFNPPLLNYKLLIRIARIIALLQQERSVEYLRDDMDNDKEFEWCLRFIISIEQSKVLEGQFRIQEVAQRAKAVLGLESE